MRPGPFINRRRRENGPCAGGGGVHFYGRCAYSLRPSLTPNPRPLLPPNPHSFCCIPQVVGGTLDEKLILPHIRTLDHQFALSEMKKISSKKSFNDRFTESLRDLNIKTEQQRNKTKSPRDLDFKKHEREETKNDDPPSGGGGGTQNAGLPGTPAANTHHAKSSGKFNTLGTASGAASDHRRSMLDTDNKVPPWVQHVRMWMTKAIDSIACYVERSSLFLILVPLCAHSDRIGEMCDYGNWRGRGWCRLELTGACLSRNEIRLMVVKNAQVW